MTRIAMLVLAILLAACAPPMRGPTVEERCGGDPICTMIGQAAEAQVAAEQPMIIQQVPYRGTVWVQPLQGHWEGLRYVPPGPARPVQVW